MTLHHELSIPCFLSPSVALPGARSELSGLLGGPPRGQSSKTYHLHTGLPAARSQGRKEGASPLFPPEHKLWGYMLHKWTNK